MWLRRIVSSFTREPVNRATRIEQWVKNQIAPIHLEVINESHSHNVPAGSETHFRLVIVSDSFAGKSLVERHRSIYSGLEQELAKDAGTHGVALHALSLQLFTANEWNAKQGKVPASPDCQGGDGSLPKRRP
jgi:BolA family transcriptional regulator, general stress-responsive regulator